MSFQVLESELHSLSYHSLFPIPVHPCASDPCHLRFLSSVSQPPVSAPAKLTVGVTLQNPAPDPMPSVTNLHEDPVSSSEFQLPDHKHWPYHLLCDQKQVI